MKESQIRDVLISKCGDLGFDGARFIHEMNLGRGKVRADLVVVKDGVHGIEIKSRFDNLSRLKHQMAGYSKVFKTVTLVCDPKHIAAAEDRIPQWFGLVSIDEKGLTLLRTATTNHLMRPEFVVGILSKRELLQHSATFFDVGDFHFQRLDEIRAGLLKVLTSEQVMDMYQSCLIARFLD